MAVRPVFRSIPGYPYYQLIEIEFVYNSGFSVVQKQRNITAVHAGFTRRYPQSKILEISSKSMQPLGTRLSAFSLLRSVPSLGYKVPVENVYQASKRFEKGGPFTDLLVVPPIKAKRDDRLTTSGRIVAYTLEGRDYPLNPTNAFYDWLYITALMENEELSQELLQYDAFTDIEFNPSSALNCQARAAAIYVSLVRNGTIEQAKDFDSFLALIARRPDPKP